jgi:tetratricopeptide (TPR) repeat protein
VNLRDRWLQRGVAAIVVLHAIAFLFFPASLWGLSHLAVWPRSLGIAWTCLALVALLLAPRLQRPTPQARGSRDATGKQNATGNRSATGPRHGTAAPRLPGFPGVGGSIIVALACGIVFWLLRERSHFFGDGALLIRDRGLSESVARAVVLVRLATAAVASGTRLGLSVAGSLAAVSVLAGIIAVFAMLRLAATLTPDRGGRFLAVSLLGTSGAMALFFGHVEYYAPLAAAVLVYLWIACRALERGTGVWASWLVATFLPALHLGTLALLPAQVYLSVVAWRRGARAPVLAGALAGGIVATLTVHVAGGGAGALAGTTVAGFHRYLAPYGATASATHDFGFWSAGHLLAIVNDLLLVAPLAVAAIPAIWIVRHQTGDAPQRFLLIAAMGSVLLSCAFHRELGPYRDWDLLAWSGFVLLAAVAVRFVRPHPGSQRVAIAVVVIGGLDHLVPWIALQVVPGAALAHVRTVLDSRSQWSPHARGYMYEEIAIALREQGDEDGSFAAYEAAVRSNSSDARFRVGLGTRYVQRGDLERARAEFEAALAVRPDYAPAHNDLAYVLVLLGGDLESARSHADRALAASPGNPDYSMTRARVRWALGDAAGAREDVESVLRQRPDSQSARALLATIQAGPGSRSPPP